MEKAREKTNFKNRILKFDRIPHTLIEPHPLNPRIHLAQQQDVLKAMLEKYGIVDAIVVRKIAQNKYQLINGHLRHGQIQQKIPALIIDADDRTAAKLLATYDSISTAAAVNQAALKKLISAQGEIDAASQPIFESLMGKMVALEDYEKDLDLEKQFGLVIDRKKAAAREASGKKKSKDAPKQADTNLVNLYFAEQDYQEFTRIIESRRADQGGKPIPITTIVLDAMRACA